MSGIVLACRHCSATLSVVSVMALNWLTLSFFALSSRFMLETILHRAS